MQTGILLINLGTPDGPDRASVRRYLREFLSDPRVIEKRGALWWLLLNGFILPRQSVKSAAAYAAIWDRELNTSPLRAITRQQAEKLALSLTDNRSVSVGWAMRYGNPSIKSALKELTGAGCDRVLLFPLYPQYSGATTGSALDKAYDALSTLRHQPSLRTVPPYFADDTYIKALADSIGVHIAALNWTPEIILVSFHSLPEAFIRSGDPYQSHCQTSFGRLQTALGPLGTDLSLAYQSRGRGRAAWLEPQLDRELVRLAGNGVRNVCVVCPGFASDCIETLEEVEIRAARTFRIHGGTNFSFIPCLNDSDAAIALMRNLVTANLVG